MHAVTLRANDGTAVVDQTFSITVSRQVPAPPVGTLPEDGAVDVEVPPTVSWRAVPGARSYDLQLAEVGDFSILFLEARELPDTTFEVQGLAELTTYFWRVRAVNEAGAGDWSATHRFTTSRKTGREDDVVPLQFGLEQNYPNPFRDATHIVFETTDPGMVYVLVYDVLGRRIATLVQGMLAPGRHEVRWDGRTDGGSAAGSGPYFYRLQQGRKQAVRTMLLVR